MRAPDTQTLTTSQAAMLLGCRRHQLAYLIRSAKMPEPRRVGGERRWSLHDLLVARRAMGKRRRPRRESDGH